MIPGITLKQVRTLTSSQLRISLTTQFLLAAWEEFKMTFVILEWGLLKSKCWHWRVGEPEEQQESFTNLWSLSLRQPFLLGSSPSFLLLAREQVEQKN